MNIVTSSNRRWMVVPLVLVIGTGLILALLHAPFGRRAVLGFATRLLDDRLGVQLQAERLDHNLLTLDFELTGLSLATPFFSVGRVRIDLPWLAVTGPLALTVVEVDAATLSLIQSADGGWNLPASSEGEASGTASPFALPPVGRVDLTDLGISVQAPDYDVAATAIALTLATAGESAAQVSGPLHVAQPIQIRWKDQRTTLDQLDGQIAFDGASLALQPLELGLPEGHLVVEGRVLSLFSEPTFDLTYRGDLILGWAATWWRPGSWSRRSGRGQRNDDWTALGATLHGGDRDIEAPLGRGLGPRSAGHRSTGAGDLRHRQRHGDTRRWRS